VLVLDTSLAIISHCQASL